MLNTPCPSTDADASSQLTISNASDEEMSDEKSLAMCKVTMGTFVFLKRKSC